MTNTRPTVKNPALRMAFIRQLHAYVAVFIAPTLLFFCITGAFQTFRIPDRKDAPVLLQKLARVHRDDVFALKPPPPAKKPEAKAADDQPAKAPVPKPAPRLGTTLIKWFFVGVASAFVFITILGLWIALLYNRQKRLMWGLLIAGTVIPMLILAL